ncbi:GTP 3',8-cyclase MoaA [Caenispirillum salinarum]|uniref:GTP 3',8-cyclase MoaA n=1 Tax=Caenispirillum salinarum TaxID=859058 RepID=UPI0038502F55
MAPSLTDLLGRRITYLRLSVTERCDFRCHYCIAEDQAFAPKSRVLSIEELGQVADAFLDLGVTDIRLTGGEPLTRKGLPALLDHLGRRRAEGRLKALTLTTNGSMLEGFVPLLAQSGVGRVNVSLDTVDDALFSRITRRGDLSAVMSGISAAKAAGMGVKLNCVVQKGVNDSPHHIDRLIEFAAARGHDLTFIEVMPIGPAAFDFHRHYRPMDDLKAELARRWTLLPDAHRTPGPSRYWRCVETGGRIGFIAATSACFCAGCNRVRVASDGMLYPCLGQDHAVDLRVPLRSAEPDALKGAIARAIGLKPDGHRFHDGATPGRAMNATGG